MGRRNVAGFLGFVFAVLAACAGDEAVGPGPRVASVVLSPATDTVRVGEKLQLVASAVDGRGRPVAGVRFRWRTSRTEVATVDTAGGVIGVGVGAADIIATADGVDGSARIAVGPRVPAGTMVEARALWVTRWDWTSAAEIVALLDAAAAARFNIVYFQVRGNADAFYRPGLEPWSHVLTGTLGRDPAWDPLEVASARARALGLELHVWLNAFIGWCPSTPPTESLPRHLLLEHPDWIMVDVNRRPMPWGTSGCVWLTPGAAGVRTRLAAVSADLARRYGVDGIHLDFIRYPGRDYSYDAFSLAAFDSARAREPGLSFDEFRRRLVTAAVREVADSLRRVRPATRLSAAAWGVYRDLRGWSGVLTGYEGVLQDARAWVKDGLVDAVAPMVYWPIQPAYGDRLDFAYLADEHAGAVSGRHVYIGISLERIDLAKLSAQIERARAAGAEGVSILSARLLREQSLWTALADGPFQDPAVTPPMPWRGGPVVAGAGR